MRFASLNSPNASVRARLQAALFTNRKRNKQRREISSSPSSPWVIGSIVLGKDPAEEIYGYLGGAYGSVSSEMNQDFTIVSFLVYSDDEYCEIVFAGDCVSDLLNKKILMNSNIIYLADISFDGTNTYAYPLIQFSLTAANVGQTFTLELQNLVYDPADWGAGTLTVAYEPVNDGYGYGSPEFISFGSVTEPNPEFPIFTFWSRDLTTGVWSIVFKNINLTPLFSPGTTLTINGHTETLLNTEFMNIFFTANFTNSDPMNSGDIGAVLPFSFNFPGA